MAATKLVFCSDPLNPRQPDEAYQVEVAAAERLGIPFVQVDHDALVHENDPTQAVHLVSQQTTLQPRRLPGPDDDTGLIPALFEALEGKGVRLMNDPAAYRHCHYLPESYPVIEPHMPRSGWVKTAGRFQA